MKTLKADFVLGAVVAVCLLNLPVGAQVLFNDGFESYAIGSSMHGQGGWAGWDNVASATGFATNSPVYAGARSLQIVGASDLVHTFSGFTSGQAIFSLRQYVPSTSSGSSFIILLNQYSHGGPYNWSVQTFADMVNNQIVSDPDGNGSGPSLPLLKNQWVEYKAMINLTANSVTEYYGGQFLNSYTWQSGGFNALAAVDLFGNNAGPVFYDNVSVIPEPTTLSLLALAGLALGLRRRNGC